MGFDVSYHPISRQQIVDWYLTPLSSDEAAAALCDEAGIPDLYKQKFLDFLPQFRSVDKLAPFDSTHGFYIAVTQGFFGQYHYLRGAMLSQVGAALLPYTQSWRELAPELVGDLAVNDRIDSNYTSGVYIAPDKVSQLMHDLGENAELRASFDEVFPGEHLNILWTAMSQAVNDGLGLLEATEVIEPNPTDLNSSKSYSNLFNCDPAGALLYQQTALGQLTELGIDPSNIEIDHVVVGGAEELASAAPEAVIASPTSRGGVGLLRRFGLK